MKDPKISTNPIHPSYAEPGLIRDAMASARYTEDRMNWDFDPSLAIRMALAKGRLGALSALKAFNYYTGGYLACIDVVEGKRNPEASDEQIRQMEARIPESLKWVDSLVDNLSINDLIRMNPIIFKAINDIYGRYGKKGFYDGKYSVELKEKLDNIATILKASRWSTKLLGASEEVMDFFVYLISKT